METFRLSDMEIGITHELLSLVFERQMLEDRIMLGLGFSWHWDMEGLEIDRFRYRQVVEQLFAPFGFVEYLTSEPNIRMDPANILLARLGSSLDQQAIINFSIACSNLTPCRDYRSSAEKRGQGRRDVVRNGLLPAGILEITGELAH